MASVVIQDIYKTLGAVPVLKGISLEVPDQACVVFIGPSGCGKTTLLRSIAGLEVPDKGQIFIGGKDVTKLHPARRGVSMVFQSYALYPHMTVAQNMAFGLKLNGWRKKAERDQRVKDVARILHLDTLLDRKPAELSGGQRQRVAIGRAIARQPDVFLLDEPLSNLDASLRMQMRIELANLRDELKSTMIYVTHDQVEAMTLADKIVILKDGQIVQMGSPLELYHHPLNQFVAHFIGSPPMNFLKGVAPFERVTLGVRPEVLRFTQPAEQFLSIQANIRHLEYLGAETYAYCSVENGQSITLRVPQGAKTGDNLMAYFRYDDCHFFDEAGKALTMTHSSNSILKII